ncbi:PREDICTED: ras-related GTP-binding protein C-like, partial [Rhagoletis zephyria]|uniref:ras-related GTP-binding protein C-like n=1 Tax=Rhagoletis zephyria TaxID=28612 RepID=UPI0008118791
ENFEDKGYSVPAFKAFGYPGEENLSELHEAQHTDKMFSPDTKPKIIIMGLRRSGKSSIQKVVFHKMSPNETLFLESTNKVVKEDISNNSFVSFTIWDFPGQMDIFDREFDFSNVFKGCGALVFVIDSQDDYVEALFNLNQTVKRAHAINPNINFEVFIHKVDGLSDDHKIEARQEIHSRANDDLQDQGDDGILLSFYLTSIYDHSIFEAFSKVVQKLIPQLPILENLLNVFISSSGIEKAFLFDVVSKIFIATDSSPVDMQSYELCCDMIDVVIDISCIYGVNEAGEGSTFDNCSSSCIRLNSSTVLYLREVNKFLALVCILREENFTKQGLIDYNFQCFRKSIQDVFVSQSKNDVAAARMSSTSSTPYGSSNVPDAEDIGDSVPAAVGDILLASSYPNDSIDSGVLSKPLPPSLSSTPTINNTTNASSSSSYKHTPPPSSSPHISATGHNPPQSHRKIAILPTNSTVSSLPTTQMYHPAAVAEKNTSASRLNTTMSPQWSS